MKKAILCLTLIAALAIPFSAFGLEMLNDNSLQEVTGQAGVSIAVDDIQLFLHVDKFAYVDCDGFSTNSNYGGTEASAVGGAFVVEDFEMDTININMIGAAGGLALFYEGKAGLTTTTGVAAYYAGKGLDASHIKGGTAYGLAFEDSGNTWFRNAGHQTMNAVNGGYFKPTWASSVDQGFTGSLPLASAASGSIPLFYDYGQTTITGCSLGSGLGANNFGLNHYTNTNNISTLATFHPQAITIDITGALPLHTAGLAKAADPGSNVTIGGVLIGLPTAEIHIQQMNIGALTFTSEIHSDNSINQNDSGKNIDGIAGNETYAELVKNDGDSFGAIFIEGVTFTTFGGWMEIAPTHY